MTKPPSDMGVVDQRSVQALRQLFQKDSSQNTLISKKSNGKQPLQTQLPQVEPTTTAAAADNNNSDSNNSDNDNNDNNESNISNRLQLLPASCVIVADNAKCGRSSSFNTRKRYNSRRRNRSFDVSKLGGGASERSATVPAPGAPPPGVKPVRRLHRGGSILRIDTASGTANNTPSTSSTATATTTATAATTTNNNRTSTTMTMSPSLSRRLHCTSFGGVLSEEEAQQQQHEQQQQEQQQEISSLSSRRAGSGSSRRRCIRQSSSSKDEQQQTPLRLPGSRSGSLRNLFQKQSSTRSISSISSTNTDGTGGLLSRAGSLRQMFQKGSQRCLVMLTEELEQNLKCQKRNVQFADPVLTDSIPPPTQPFTQAEMKQYFLTSADIQHYQKDSALTILDFLQVQKKGKVWVEKDHSIRGLEDLLYIQQNANKNIAGSNNKKGTISKEVIRKNHREAVLEEQSRQQQLGIKNYATLAEVSNRFSKKSKLAANTFGKKDYATVKKLYPEIADYTTTTSSSFSSVLSNSSSTARRRILTRRRSFVE